MEMKLDEEMSKYLDIQKIECTCGKSINIFAEIISK